MEKTLDKAKSILWKIAKFLLAVLVFALIINFFLGRSTSSVPAPTEEKTAVTTPATETTTVAPAVVKTEEAVIRDGIRESLRLEFGTVNRTVEMKSLPTVKWESAGGDPNLRFPIDTSGDLVLGVSPTEPPAIVDPEPGYRWVKIEKAGDAPAKWKGAVEDTGRVFGIVPAVLAKGK